VFFVVAIASPHDASMHSESAVVVLGPSHEASSGEVRKSHGECGRAGPSAGHAHGESGARSSQARSASGQES